MVKPNSLRSLRFGAVLLCAFMTTAANSAAGGETPAKTELATFGGGCFWCVEAVFERLEGVKKVVSGYAGGHIDQPSYKQVCSGETGHAEVTQIEFDPAVISYARLLEVFFEAHDPTTLNRQGADEGTQYRSVIFYHSEEQKKAAEAAKIAARKIWEDPIVTEISPLPRFWPAEDYHQDYFRNNPSQGYCAFVIKPKLKKLQQKGVIPK
jgi:peptide-methionine (S)-S-oxide reductase